MKRDLSQVALRNKALDSVEELEKFTQQVISQSKTRFTNANDDADATYVFRYN